jgi:hypothetical protein
VQLRGRGGSTPPPSFPPGQSASSAVSTERALERAFKSIVDFELLRAIEAHELNTLRGGRLSAHSPNREIALAAAAPSALIGGVADSHGHETQLSRPCRPNRRRHHQTDQTRAPRVQGQADRAVTWTSGSRHWSCRTLSWPAASRHPCPQAQRPIQNLHMTLHARPRERRRPLGGPLQLGPRSSLSLGCGHTFPVVAFSAAPPTPLRPVHTARPDDAAHFSLGLGHIRTFPTSPFPPFGATGDAESTRGRRRGGIEAVRWRLVVTSTHVIVMHACGTPWRCGIFLIGRVSHAPISSQLLAVRRPRKTLHGRARSRGGNEAVRR